jgi:CheY-like chemotaxis protein
MGGEIQCESELGEGSIFSFAIPLEARAASSISGAEDSVAVTSPRRILIIEDNDINRFLLLEVLNGLGHDVSAASGGAEGLQMIKDGVFDLIISDISMPKVDGLDVIRQTRAAHLADETDLVALTAHCAAEDHARILGAGFAEVLTKPVCRDDLASLIARRCGDDQDAPLALPRTPGKVTGASDIDQFVSAVGAVKARDYLGDLRVEILQLVQALEQTSTLSEDLRQEAHRLAGSAAVLGLAQLRKCLLDVETTEDTSGQESARLMDVWRDAEGVVAPFMSA